ncbi:Meprin A subunit beta [Branchiostoma belcheri]|nr:Meprin A subunit beta [Branchiostoma belcheri]
MLRGQRSEESFPLNEELETADGLAVVAAVATEYSHNDEDKFTGPSIEVSSDYRATETARVMSSLRYCTLVLFATHFVAMSTSKNLPQEDASPAADNSLNKFDFANRRDILRFRAVVRKGEFPGEGSTSAHVTQKTEAPCGQDSHPQGFPFVVAKLMNYLLRADTVRPASFQQRRVVCLCDIRAATFSLDFQFVEFYPCTTLQTDADD